ncbi:hypothetical protein [Solimonas flava]|uniref:hypothetical protein n=1 Tax=Solimonas flava TaxID=415849 RepID=UPI000481C20A|nr:hypothetical protein [Solimonas flava]
MKDALAGPAIAAAAHPAHRYALWGGCVRRALRCSWTEANPAIRAALRSPADVARLIHAYWKDAREAATVGEFAMLDLDGDHQLELVATLDRHGRGLFSTLMVIARAGDSLYRTELSSNGPHLGGLRERILVEERDGAITLNLARRLPGCSRDEPASVITVTYRYDHGAMTPLRVSSGPPPLHS